MTVTKQLIDNVNKIKTTLNEISVYNLDVKTAIELYYELAKKVNEVINELSRFEGVVSEEVVKQNEKLLYLLGEGLKEQVGIKIDELITNGTIQDLINNKIFSDLNNKIETFKQQTDEQFKTNTINKNSKEYYMINSNISPKLVYNTNGHVFVISKKVNGKGYIRTRLREGLVDSSSSSAGGNAQLLRPVEVLECSECFVLTTSSYGDSSTNWITTTLPYMSIQVPCKSLTSATSNAYVEYKITIPTGVNSINALVWNSNASSDSVDISVDGIKVSNASLKKSTSQWGYVHIPITQGEHVVRFTTVNAGYMTIAGVGVVELKDWKDGYSYDFFVDVSSTTNPYITNGGAIDYALWDSDTGLYCGSFHGGETRSSIKLIADGVTKTLNNGANIICNIFEVEQQTNIVSKINAYSRYIFKNDCTIEFEVYFNGNINLKALFTNMTTSHTNFNLCLYPRYVDTTNAGTYYMPRGCNYIVQKNQNTNQKIVTILNDNIIAGANILPYIQSSQYYNKVYKENIKSVVGVNFKEGNFKSVHYFE